MAIHIIIHCIYHSSHLHVRQLLLFITLRLVLVACLKAYSHQQKKLHKIVISRDSDPVLRIREIQCRLKGIAMHRNFERLFIYCS
jgi:hypothetical protein